MKESGYHSGSAVGSELGWSVEPAGVEGGVQVLPAVAVWLWPGLVALQMKGEDHRQGWNTFQTSLHSLFYWHRKAQTPVTP